jgi:aryl-alcohol dehydrogenase-like predicted oxidoreductase
VTRRRRDEKVHEVHEVHGSTEVHVRERRFGRTGWQVSEVGYGMWGMGGWTGSDDDESLGSLHRAIALGCTFFDTAWVYGQGRSETLLGQTIRSHPDARIVVATKIPRSTCGGRRTDHIRD